MSLPGRLHDRDGCLVFMLCLTHRLPSARGTEYTEPGYTFRIYLFYRSVIVYHVIYFAWLYAPHYARICLGSDLPCKTGLLDRQTVMLTDSQPFRPCRESRSMLVETCSNRFLGRRTSLQMTSTESTDRSAMMTDCVRHRRGLRFACSKGAFHSRKTLFPNVD